MVSGFWTPLCITSVRSPLLNQRHHNTSCSAVNSFMQAPPHPPCLPRVQRLCSPGLSTLKKWDREFSIIISLVWISAWGWKCRDAVTTRSWITANIKQLTHYKFSWCAVEESTSAPTTGVELVGRQRRKSVVLAPVWMCIAGCVWNTAAPRNISLASTTKGSKLR